MDLQRASIELPTLPCFACHLFVSEFVLPMEMSCRSWTTLCWQMLSLLSPPHPMMTNQTHQNQCSSTSTIARWRREEQEEEKTRSERRWCQQLKHLKQGDLYQGQSLHSTKTSEGKRLDMTSRRHSLDLDQTPGPFGEWECYQPIKETRQASKSSNPRRITFFIPQFQMPHWDRLKKSSFLPIPTYQPPASSSSIISSSPLLRLRMRNYARIDTQGFYHSLSSESSHWHWLVWGVGMAPCDNPPELVRWPLPIKTGQKQGKFIRIVIRREPRKKLLIGGPLVDNGNTGPLKGANLDNTEYVCTLTVSCSSIGRNRRSLNDGFGLSFALGMA